MTPIEEKFARAVFEHADELPLEFFTTFFWRWFDSANLREEKGETLWMI
ncbi:MAG: hypothetical protein IJ774_09990 [Selenomonadaceae bacterium]|nr:hypothetical protein [Selenomonadaceae bacterium]